MSREASLLSVRGTLALLAALATGTGVVIAALYGGGGELATAETPQLEPERPVRRPVQPVREEEPQARLERPTLNIEEMRLLAPDERELAELERQDFERMGGIDSPGADAEGARHEVGRPGWAEAMKQELRAGLTELVLGEGVTLDRLDCTRGRCLIELQFRDMLDGLGRVDALRQWAGQRVRCRTYSEGPLEGTTPWNIPSQQIWILCGEPGDEGR
jgi:hypothetical protein